MSVQRAEWFNPSVGKLEPWPRCAYCNTHVLDHGEGGRRRCDCGATTYRDGDRVVSVDRATGIEAVDD